MDLSVCYILKNEREYIRRSIESVVPFAKEVLIQDHGSDDGSLEIIQSLQLPQVKIFKEKWRDDFSWARNHLAGRASQPWVLFVDGDEILDPSAESILQKAVTQRQRVFSIIQRNYTHDALLADVRRAEDSKVFTANERGHSSLFCFDNWMERLYRPEEGASYEGRIHESLVPSARRSGLLVDRLPLILHHFGRLKAGHSQKLDYYRQLAQQKLSERPEDPASWVEWMLILDERGEWDEAFSASLEAVDQFSQEPLIFEVSYRVAFHAGEYEKSLSYIEQLLQLSPKHSRALQERVIPLLYLGRWEECSKLCKEILLQDPQNFLAHLHLGIIFFERKQWASAKQHLQIAQNLKPQDEFLHSALKKIPENL
jgi:glycosyltransferase involved in cell wall biosynthesis